MEMTKLHESLFILFKCSRTVNRVYKALEEHREKGILRSFNHYSHNLAYYVIMESNSFLDEYNKFFIVSNVEPEYMDRVRIVRDVLNPLVKKINNWKDLSLYRDNIVAHGWRDKKNGKRLIVPHPP
jgi:hypothetical protein